MGVTTSSSVAANTLVEKLSAGLAVVMRWSTLMKSLRTLMVARREAISSSGVWALGTGAGGGGKSAPAHHTPAGAVCS